MTGWYAGSGCQWSTDRKRRKVFDKIRDASPVCDELRALCPRNAAFINIETARHDLSRDMAPLAPELDLLQRR